MLDFKNACLQDVLNHKTMYYDKIDFSIVKNSWETLSTHIKLPFVIHIVGTNGKGSTGRYLAHYLHKKSYKTLHYSSPHILKFNERIWINGKDSSDEDLETAHKKLQEILDEYLLSKLTYFEYTTLLALIISSDMDYLVLEAGLGGEFDATNVVKNDLSLITTIDLDHQSFLGNTVEEIARTKMRSVDTKMLVGFQVHEEVKKEALNVKKALKEEFNKDIKIQYVEDFLKYDFKNINASYLKRNLHLVCLCLEELNINIDTKLFEDLKLNGRCEKIKKNITIDVGHNPLAAKALYEEFKDKKVNLIYNSYKDKDYEEVLKILKPVIAKLSIMELDDSRIVQKDKLISLCENLDINLFKLDEVKEDEEYLVFGSFLVVEKFLRNMELDEK